MIAQLPFPPSDTDELRWRSRDVKAGLQKKEVNTDESRRAVISS